VIILLLLGIAVATVLWARGILRPRIIVDVYPGDDIQATLEALAHRPGKGTIRVHAGTYRPRAPAQALVYFNARHDGITMEAVGEVILTAANTELAEPSSASYPAVVNHVIYFGDGISRATTFRGFKITGANGFVLGPPDLMTVHSRAQLEKSRDYRSSLPSPIEANNRLRKTYYFFSDGGGILIYGKSHPTIEAVEVYDNYASVCAGGVSIQHSPGPFRESVLFRNCIFRGNRAAATGSAVDLLTSNGWATFENCLFVGNLSNTAIGPNEGPGYSALSVFPGCRATVIRCTFTGNRNGVDDRGIGSSYRDTIFWRNDRDGGVGPTMRYELIVGSPEGVAGCFIGGGEATDPLRNVNRSTNRFDVPNPDFDVQFRPRHRAFDGVGYRPLEQASQPALP
jgi:Right handed beta helix region